MELITENTHICAEDEHKLKRKHDDCSADTMPTADTKKLKVETAAADEEGKQSNEVVNAQKLDNHSNIQIHVHRSPKKRIEFNKRNEQKVKNKQKFIYGNYSQYYGYRNKDYHDIRLDVFNKHQSLFMQKRILDIGCNNGFITMEIAKTLPIKHIIGLDIDVGLIKQANKHLVRLKKSLPIGNPAAKQQKFPYNITFQHGNYVLRNDVLLEIEREQFDMILCLSVTKWIHLNFGDAGLKQAFRRMYLQLQPGGVLVLEAQPFDNYGRRKKMTDTIFTNYTAMQFFPKHFTDYLLSTEVGFKRVEEMGVPEHCVAGFKRPIQIFFKE